MLNNKWAFGVTCGVAGAGIGAGVTYAIMKKKASNKKALEEKSVKIEEKTVTEEKKEEKTA